MATHSTFQKGVDQPQDNRPRGLLEVHNLHTQFITEEGVVKAVDGASFQIESGRTLGIVGESGSGKSVTARSILQILDRSGRIVDGRILYRPQQGQNAGSELDIIALGRNSPEIRAIRGGSISMIFQEPMSAFSPVHTFGNQIIEAIRLHSTMDKGEAFDVAVDWMKRVGMPNPEQRMAAYPHELSGGQRQRAMIAMALSTNPEILIADEPTTALDVTTQAQILDLLRNLQAQTGMAIMFITHDLGVIAEIADDVAVMYLGTVVERGPVEKIFRSPKHPYTRALHDSIPSIFAKPRERLPSITGAIPHPYNRPSGCPFHPRCSSFMAGKCEMNEPKLVTVDHLQDAACFLYEGS